LPQIWIWSDVIGKPSARAFRRGHAPIANPLALVGIVVAWPLLNICADLLLGGAGRGPGAGHRLHRAEEASALSTAAACADFFSMLAQSGQGLSKTPVASA